MSDSLQIFKSHIGKKPGFSTLVYNEFKPPLYGQTFKVEPLKGSSASILAIRVKFRGCGK